MATMRWKVYFLTRNAWRIVIVIVYRWTGVALSHNNVERTLETNLIAHKSFIIFSRSIIRFKINNKMITGRTSDNNNVENVKGRTRETAFSLVILIR